MNKSSVSKNIFLAVSIFSFIGLSALSPQSSDIAKANGGHSEHHAQTHAHHGQHHDTHHHPNHPNHPEARAFERGANTGAATVGGAAVVAPTYVPPPVVYPPVTPIVPPAQPAK